MAYLRCTGTPGGSLKLRTAQGEIASFETNMADVLQEVKCELAPSLTGYTAVNLTACGVNLWNEETELGTIDIATGIDVPGTSNLRSAGYIPCKPNTTYYFNRGSFAGNMFEYGADKSFVRIDAGATTFTTTANTRYLRFYLGSAYGTTYNNDISINYPSTDTTYHAYTGNAYAIALGDTYYGGTLDVTTGVLTVTHKRVDLGLLTWNKSGLGGGHYGFLATNSDMIPNPATSVKFSGICSGYDTLKAQEVYNATVGISSWAEGAKNIMIYDDTLESGDATAFKAAMSGIYLTYELATPVTVQLSPTAVRAIVGANNVFADTGTTELKYLTIE